MADLDLLLYAVSAVYLLIIVHKALQTAHVAFHTLAVKVGRELKLGAEDRQLVHVALNDGQVFRVKGRMLPAHAPTDD